MPSSKRRRLETSSRIARRWGQVAVARLLRGRCTINDCWKGERAPTARSDRHWHSAQTRARAYFKTAVLPTRATCGRHTPKRKPAEASRAGVVWSVFLGRPSVKRELSDNFHGNWVPNWNVYILGGEERGDVLNGEGGFREISRNAMIGRLIAERSFCFSIM